MQKAIYSINSSSQKNVVKGLKKAGLRQASMNRPISREEIGDILGVLPESERRRLLDGRSQMIPRNTTEFTNRNGSVVSIDFDIQENQIFRSDPVVIIKEYVPNTLSLVVREILEDTVKIDLLKAALKSINNQQFLTSVIDLAGLTGDDENVVYERCVKTLIQYSISGMKRLDVKEEDFLSKRTPQIPARVV